MITTLLIFVWIAVALLFAWVFGGVAKEMDH